MLASAAVAVELLLVVLVVSHSVMHSKGLWERPSSGNIYLDYSGIHPVRPQLSPASPATAADDDDAAIIIPPPPIGNYAISS